MSSYETDFCAWANGRGASLRAKLDGFEGAYGMTMLRAQGEHYPS